MSYWPSTYCLIHIYTRCVSDLGVTVNPNWLSEGVKMLHSNIVWQIWHPVQLVQYSAARWLLEKWGVKRSVSNRKEADGGSAGPDSMPLGSDVHMSWIIQKLIMSSELSLFLYEFTIQSTYFLLDEWCSSVETFGLSKRPSKYSLIHFYKRCVSHTRLASPSNIAFCRSNDAPLKTGQTTDNTDLLEVNKLLLNYLLDPVQRTYFWLKKGLSGTYPSKLSKRPSINSLIHFYKRCVSHTWMAGPSNIPFCRSNDAPL